MNKKNVVFVLMLICVFVPTKVLAHPGRTDSSGCHVCRTNCTKWGLYDGERHCHGENSSSNNSSTSTVTTPQTNNNTNNNYNNNSQTNTYSSKSENSIIEEPKKSNNTKIKTIKVNGKEVTIYDEMTTNTTKKDIKLKITPEDENAKVEYQLKELVIGENIFKINVTAEDGTKKEYKLIIKREKGIGTVTITKFSLGNNDIEFDNNKATVNVLYGETINDYSYELSDKNAKLKLYINNKEVSDISDVKGNDEIKLVVIDEDDNELIYIIKITEDGPIISAIINIVAYSLVIGILVAPIIIIILVVKNIKKKIKK